MKETEVHKIREKYFVSVPTWIKWMQPLVKKKIIKPWQKKYTPKQIKAIYELLGDPD